MRSRLLRSKKVLCIGGFLALTVLVGSIFVAKTKTEEANASSYQNVTIGNNGWVQTTNAFTINGQAAWCVTPNLGTPVDVGYYYTRQAVVYSLDELRSGYSNGYNISNISRMFTAYYYTKETNSALFSNVEAMHWGLANLYGWAGRNTGVNAGQVWDNGYKAFPSNLASGSVTIVPAQNGRQALFTANYEVKEETQNLTVKKIWHDGLEDHSGVQIHYQVRVRGGDVLYNDTLSEADGWVKKYTDLPVGQEYEIVEDFAASGFTSTTLEDGSTETVWHIDAIKDKNGNPIYYFSPTAASQVCSTTNNGLTATCTMYNNAYDYTGINMFLYKHWRDTNAGEIRPESVTFEVHAFRSDNNQDVTSQLPRLSPEDSDYIYQYSLPGDGPDKEVWGGRYIANLPTHIVIDGNRYELYYAIREIKIPAAYRVSCKEGDGDIEVHWYNEENYIDFEVVKTWNDGGNILKNRPFMVAFDVYQNGAYYNTYSELDPSYFDDEEQDVWVMHERLPEFDAEGNKYIYTYREIDYYSWRSGAIMSDLYDIDERIISAGSREGMVNTVKTDIPVIKCWSNDDESKRPDEMKFNLLVNDDVVDTLTLTKENENEDGCWTGSFDDLPLFDEDGNKITYEVEEDPKSVENTNYQVDIDICKVDVEERVRNAAEGEEVDMGCYFTNRYVDVPKTSAKSMKPYWVVATAILAGGYLAVRRVFSRR